jgi:hypothetical protein
MDEPSSHYFSRFAVVSLRERAWALDDRFRLYAFDGTKFWRRRKGSTRYVTIPSWKAPAFGWMHEAECTCYLCSAGTREAQRAA